MKKFISILLCFVMVLGLSATVNAANELATATKYTLGVTVKGDIYEGNESDVYKFELKTSAKVEFNLFADMERVDFKLYDATGKELWSDRPSWNSTTEEISYTRESVLNKGEYFVSLSKAWGKWDGEYELKILETAIYETFSEIQNGENNSTKKSDFILVGKEYVGCISINDDTDVYNFSIPTSGNLDLSFFSDMERVDLKLYDATGKELWSDRPSWNSTTEEISYNKMFYLCKGQYYFSASKSWGKCEGSYSFKFLFSSADESFSEPQNGSNNKVSAANLIAKNQKYVGFLALNDEIDIYRISISNKKLAFKLSAGLERVEIKMYDTQGKELWSERPSWNSTIEEINFAKEVALAPGDYFVAISKSYGKNEGRFVFWFEDGKSSVSEPKFPERVISVVVNDDYVSFDQPPVLDNGRTLVPVRAIFEALGASVEWDGVTQTVTSKKDGTTVSMQIGSTQMYVNGKVKVLDVPAKIINSRTLVPVRAVSEAFGGKVDWIQDTQTVVISQ